MVFELNYIVVSNNTEIGGGGLSQIFCGRFLATLLYAFFENIDFNVILCTNVTKDVLKEHKIVIK
jgi:hypothetical protein